MDEHAETHQDIVATLRRARAYASYKHHPKKEILDRLAQAIISESAHAGTACYRMYSLAYYVARLSWPVDVPGSATDHPGADGNYREYLLAMAAGYASSGLLDDARRVLDTYDRETIGVDS